MIKIQNLQKKFDDKIVIHDASCEFDTNKVTVILGPSGSGKTTLVRCINGLESQDSGEIYYNSKKITPKNKDNIHKKIGFVFQSFNLFAHMSVRENLTFSPVQLGILSKEKAEEKSLEILSSLSIENKVDFLPKNLSGGQKQRVAIARALIMDPEVMIFDEPTSALDPESIKDVVSIIKDLRKKITTIVVTHHVNFAKTIADKVIFMDQGHILTEQNTDEFFKKPKSIRSKLYLSAVADFA